MKKLLTMFLLSVVAATATTFDLFNDFQNSAFSYGYTTTLGGTFNPYTITDTSTHSGVTALLRSGTFTANPPYVAKNTTGSPLNVGLSFLIPSDMLDVHPGSAGEDTVIRFTATALTAGTYNVNGMFDGLDTATTDVHILDNNVAIFNGNINGKGNTSPFSVMVTLAAGDTLSFAVGYGSNGTYISDSTGVEATITPAAATPEPASLALSACGLIGVLMVSRWRRGPKMAPESPRPRSTRPNLHRPPAIA